MAEVIYLKEGEAAPITPRSVVIKVLSRGTPSGILHNGRVEMKVLYFDVDYEIEKYRGDAAYETVYVADCHLMK